MGIWNSPTPFASSVMVHRSTMKLLGSTTSTITSCVRPCSLQQLSRRRAKGRDERASRTKYCRVDMFG
eukprot:7192270-Pyramimonas_sp.AAC.1